MPQKNSNKRSTSASKRLLVCSAAGIVAGFLAGVLGSLKIAPLVGWDCLAMVYVSWMWLTIWPLNSSQTKKLAKTEDPTRTITDIILSLASVASLIGVALVLIQGSSTTGTAKGLYAALGVLSVILSWSVIHTLYTLKYAERYYAGTHGGVNFNQTTPPRYSDFAYLSFTLGMTFQVSDTSLNTNEMRRIALHQAQLSYFFGTIIIATTINLVVGLSK